MSAPPISLLFIKFSLISTSTMMLSISSPTDFCLRGAGRFWSVWLIFAKKSHPFPCFLLQVIWHSSQCFQLKAVWPRWGWTFPELGSYCPKIVVKLICRKFGSNALSAACVYFSKLNYFLGWHVLSHSDIWFFFFKPITCFPQEDNNFLRAVLSIMGVCDKYPQYFFFHNICWFTELIIKVFRRRLWPKIFDLRL